MRISDWSSDVCSSDLVASTNKSTPVDLFRVRCMGATMARTTTIRKRDATATRAAILTAARDRFLRDSYDSVGLRDIANGAGVDVALIGRYFGGKEGLFREVVMDEKHPKLFREPTDIGDLPAFLAQLVIEDEADDREHRMEKFVIMLRSAASPKAGEIGRAHV